MLWYGRKMQVEGTNAEVAFCRSDNQDGASDVETGSRAGLEPVKVAIARCHICDEQIQEAKLIQSSLLPTTCSATSPSRSRSATFRSPPWGDFADVFRLPDGCIGIYLGDVVGKGLPAAMYSALVIGTLRGIHKTGTDTARFLPC